MITKWTNENLLAELFYMGIEADSGILEHSKVDYIIEILKERHMLSEKGAQDLAKWIKEM